MGFEICLTPRAYLKHFLERLLFCGLYKYYSAVKNFFLKTRASPENSMIKITAIVLFPVFSSSIPSASLPCRSIEFIF